MNAKERKEEKLLMLSKELKVWTAKEREAALEWYETVWQRGAILIKAKQGRAQDQFIRALKQLRIEPDVAEVLMEIAAAMPHGDKAKSSLPNGCTINVPILAEANKAMKRGFRFPEAMLLANEKWAAPADKRKTK